MNFFRKPIFALLLVVILVISATLISVKINFTKRSEEIISTFYDGVPMDNGERDISIYSQLEIIQSESNNILHICQKYYDDMDDLDYAIDSLRLAFTYDPDMAGYIYFCYDDLCTELNTAILLINGLDASGEIDISEEDLRGIDEACAAIDAAKELISKSGYNEYVRLFLQKELNFPTENLVRLAGVQLPEYFR